jgi:hypothetical protein
MAFMLIWIIKVADNHMLGRQQSRFYQISLKYDSYRHLFLPFSSQKKNQMKQ